MTINLQTGGYSAPQVLPGARGADIQVVQKQENQPSPDLPLPAPGNNTHDVAATAEQQRYERVEQASKRLAGDPYPVSDKSFTIYKDASGQYITRYTSLRDGRVTYIPEPKLLQAFEASQSSLKAVIKLHA